MQDEHLKLLESCLSADPVIPVREVTADASTNKTNTQQRHQDQALLVARASGTRDADEREPGADGLNCRIADKDLISSLLIKNRALIEHGAISLLFLLSMTKLNCSSIE